MYTIFAVFISISTLPSNADGRFNLGRPYNDDTLLLPLPDGVDACDIGTLTIWCRPFRAIFNRVTLTRDVFVSCNLSNLFVACGDLLLPV